MTDAAKFRDSTQIVLPAREFADHRAAIESEFTVTVVEDDTAARIIGSPVEIKGVGEYLSRQGVALP